MGRPDVDVQRKYILTLALPLHNHRRANGKSPAFRAVKGQSTNRQSVSRHRTSQSEKAVTIARRNLPEQIAFGKSVHEIAVSAHATSQITQHPPRVVRMISQDPVI